MRAAGFATALLATATLTLQAAGQITPVPQRADWSAPAAAWWSHVQFLADDKLEGRKAGTPGYDKAVAYVEEQFKAIGLKPVGTKGYQQPVALVPTTVDTANSSISLKTASGTVSFELGKEITLSPHVDGSDLVSAPLVFLGYGLHVPSKHVDDFAGADLKGAPHADAPFAAERDLPGGSDSLTATLATDKPLICAFNGLAMGGGLEIGLACDIRIAADHARFALREVQVGTIPGSGGTQRLPRAVGEAQAAWMLLTGDAIDATEALRIGLVSHVVAGDALCETAFAIARRIRSNAPLAVRAVKRLMREGRALPLAEALRLERDAWGALRDTEDRAEGRAAFAEKRAPRYRGR